MTEHRTDHVVRGIARLIERYRQPRTSALLASWLTEVQAIEDALWELMTERSVMTAYGATLDLLGRIVGQPRGNMDDATYRVWIAARTLVSRSSGTTEQLLAIADKLVGGSSVVLTEYFPAAFTLEAGAVVDPPTGYAIAELLREAKPAGVAMHFLWQDSAVTDTFTFAPGTTPVPSSPLGFDAGRWKYLSDGSFTPVFRVAFEFNAADGAAGFNEGVL